MEELFAVLLRELSFKLYSELIYQQLLKLNNMKQNYASSQKKLDYFQDLTALPVNIEVVCGAFSHGIKKILET